MAEPFKNLLNRDSVLQMADAFRAAWFTFDHSRFISLAATGLESLEFKARAMLIATALEATFPARFDHAADVVETSLGPPVPVNTAGEPVNIAGKRGGEGLSG